MRTLVFLHALYDFFSFSFTLWGLQRDQGTGERYPDTLTSLPSGLYIRVAGTENCHAVQRGERIAGGDWVCAVRVSLCLLELFRLLGPAIGRILVSWRKAGSFERSMSMQKGALEECSDTGTKDREVAMCREIFRKTEPHAGHLLMLSST